MALTEKQKRFADHYIITGNVTEAARLAGYKQPHVQGSQTLENLRVREYIDKQLEEMASERVADAQEVMEYLTSVMRRDKKENVVVTLNKETSKYLPDENGTMRKQTVKEECAETIEIPAKLNDANKAAELLGKRYRLFTDKIELESADFEIKVVHDYGDNIKE